MSELNIGDRIEVINDHEEMWARKGARGNIIYDKQYADDDETVRVMFDYGDFDTSPSGGPYSWLVSTENIRKIERTKNRYKLSVI